MNYSIPLITSVVVNIALAYMMYLQKSKVSTYKDEVLSITEDLDISRSVSKNLTTQGQEVADTAVASINEAHVAGNNIVESINTKLGQIQNAFSNEIKEIKNITKITNVAVNDMTKSKEKLASLQISIEDLSELEDIIGEFVSNIEEVQDRSRAITDIAFQAKILSFNASVEASRAGEAGKGFAVVADEVGKLARLSDSTSNEIIERLNKSISTSQDMIGKIKNKIRTTTVAVVDVSENFEAVEISNKNIYNSSNQVSTNIEHTNIITSDLNKEITTELKGLLAILSDCQTSMSSVIVESIDVDDVQGQLHLFDEVIDVRKYDEFNNKLGHIIGSNCFTLLDGLDEKLKRMKPSGKYLFICRSGNRSYQACQMAKKSGIEDVYNLKGGMLTWHAKDLPVEKV